MDYKKEKEEVMVRGQKEVEAAGACVPSAPSPWFSVTKFGLI